MESKTLGREWLKFTNNILLPFGAIMSVIRILVLIGNADSLPESYVGGQVLSALVSLGLSASLFFGLKQFKSWAWYLMLVMLVLTPIGAAISRIPGNEGNQGVTVALLVIGLLVWTLPNVVYFYRRRSWFGISSDILVTPQTPNNVRPPSLLENKVTSNARSCTYHEPAEQGFPLDQIEEKAYEIAVAELESNSPKKGIWGKAFATEPNDDNRRKALYIKLRVEQIRPQGPTNVFEYEITEDGYAKLDCPQCGKEIESGEGDKLPDLACPECGRRIRLVAE